MSRDAEHPAALFLIQVLSLIIRWRCHAIRTPLETAQRTTHSIVGFNCTNVFDARCMFHGTVREKQTIAKYPSRVFYLFVDRKIQIYVTFQDNDIL